MSNTLKTVLVVIVVLIVAGAAYYWYTSMKPAVSATNPGATAGIQNTGTSGTSVAPAAGAAALPGGSSDSDAALNQDTAAIDTQMTGLNTDNANTDTSVNDQPVSQE